MMKQTLVLFSYIMMLLHSLPAGAQHTFYPPFDFPIVFSGNFGEIRANHFHGGLDFKTQGASGKPVRALADGYLKRIRVTHGSGYVLDVAYDNGYTTILRHLSAFVGEVARIVEEEQYAKESWVVEITPRPDQFRVHTGEIIALSGNTGYSFGPHLHLDLIETETDDYVDPLPFFADKVNDTTAPKAMGLMLFPKQDEGVIDGQGTPKHYDIHPRKPITAWGWIGSAIRAYDYMNGASNRYGVKSVVLTVDDREVFRSTIDRYAYSDNRYINSWTYGQYMKSFIDPGNKLKMLQADENRGWIRIDEERPYRLHYTLTDGLGNTSTVRFTIQGKRQAIRPEDHSREKLLSWDKVNVIQQPGLDLVIPKGMIYEDIYAHMALKADSGAIAYTYQLHDKTVALHNYCTLSITLRHQPVADPTKYFVAGINSKGKRYSVGGKLKDGRMKARIRELGTYTVDIDTISPTLTPLRPTTWGRRGRIEFKAKDTQTGISSYRGEIDGHYALFGKPNSIQGTIVCQLDPKHVTKGQKHELVMTVTDGCGNVTREIYTFVW